MKKMILGLITVSILMSSIFYSYTISVPKANAQAVTVIGDVPAMAKDIKDTIWNKLLTALTKAANKTYAALLNKYLTQIATQTAVYAASGFKGQKPAFLTMKKDEFWRQVASEAAGGFIENYFGALKEGSKQVVQTKESRNCVATDGATSTVTVIYEKLMTVDPVTLVPATPSSTVSLRFYHPSTSTAYTQYADVLEASNNSNDFFSQNCISAFSEALAILDAGGGEQTGYADNRIFSNMKVGGLDIGTGLNNLNVCQPSSMMVSLKIGLGLPGTPESKGDQPSCDWMEMKKNWSQAVQDSITNEKEYIKNIQNMFDIGSNDLSVAFSLSVGQDTLMKHSVSSEESEINMGNGYLANTNVAGRKIELPGGTELKLKLAQENISSPWLTKTEDAFVNAAQVFISVLSQKLYEKGMAKLMALVAGKPAGQGGSSGATPAQLMDYYGVSTFGQAQSEALMQPLLDMNFGPGQSIDLLSNLASCPDINNPGPMNCVINNNFVQAINDGLTVGEALKKNLLNKNAHFGGSMTDSGFNIESGDISWRAMKILRKYRILPVGWELAAEKLSTFGVEDSRRTIGDIVGCYSPSDSYETTYNQTWCQGLVDPTWPLVAPLSYCVKSGFGNQLSYIDVMGEDQPATSSIATILSTVNVLRAGDYCADEQSCIKEGNNDRCDVYGYCLEDRRVWKFSSDTCEPYFNSCQIFTDKQGQDIALLSNTLEYANCNADNSGCAAYCSDYNWASSSYRCSTSSEQNKYYLNGRVGSCSETEDGCTQLIRLTNNSGVNLLFNSDFEFSQAGAVSANGQLDNWHFSTSTVQGEIVNDSSYIYDGRKSLKIVNNSNESGGLLSYDWSHPDKSSFPKNFMMRTGVSYTLSAYVYSDTSTGPVTLAIGSGYGGLDTDYWQRSTSSQAGSWEKVSVTLNNDEHFNANAIAIYSEPGSTFYVDNIMFEISTEGSRNFNQYRQANYFYEKLLPSYLKSACYQQQGNVLIKKDDAPWECNNYARLCLPAEVDCQMFTNQATGDNIPAKINLPNYCPAACVGFASFWQQPTQFEDGREEQLVPKAAKSCAASSVGCSGFTNLDTLSAGGENREYFSYLRQCVKPTDPEANCGAFYMWENTVSTGLQLYSYSWQATAAGAPQLTDIKNSCSTSSLESDSLDYDADCREVRNQAGEVFYVPYSKTISCSDNCHSYRLSDYNIDERITSEADCTSASSSGHWLANQAACVICKGGGVWDDNNQACVYKGEPTESQRCTASQRGCRLYSGTGAANWRLIINDNFDSGVNGWSPNVATSSATLRNNGYSLLTNGNEVNGSLADIGLNPNAKYRLQFFAKSLAGTVNLTTTTIKEDQEDIASFNLPSGGLSLSSNDWGFYTITIDEPMAITETSSGEYIRTSNLRLHFAADGPFLLDEVRLMEVNDEYYLLNNSLNVPEVCNEDYNGAPAAGFMLGCQKYVDQNNNTHYLHSFDDLCQESAVGCEAMLDTHNWTNYYYPFRPTTSSDILADLTPADEIIYAVYDRDKICSYNDKGCQRLGRESTYEGQAVYATNFLRLDPDRYQADVLSSIKCLPQDVGCQTWNSNNGLTFFKDPGNQLCELKSSTSSNNDVSWYKRPVKQCSGSAKFCVTDQDCAAISSASQCVINNQTDEACPVNKMQVGKTIGLGGNIIQQPIKENGYNWVGLCPVTQSGCTEYLDPLSRVSSDLLGLHATTTTKTINLEAFTAYVLQARAVSANDQPRITWKVGNNPDYSFWILDSNNQLVSASGPQTLIVNTPSSNGSNPLANGYYGSVVFMTNAATKIQVIIDNLDVKEVSIRKAIINYNLNQDLTSEGCTDGQTEYDGNCLLLNERIYSQGQYSALLYDTNKTINDTNGVSPQSSATNTANRLIKVKPSRVCDKWLECTTYNKVRLDNGDTKNICSSFGLCDSFDSYNNCNHFIDLQAVSTTNQTLGESLDIGAIRNLSGYSKVGYGNTGYNNDLYNLAMMSEQGKLVDDFDFNGSFERVTGELQSDGNSLLYNYWPVGWYTTSSMAKVIVSPQQALTVDRSFQGDYLPPDGNNFLRIVTTNFSDGIYGYVKTDPQQLIPVKSNTTYTLGGSYRTDDEHSAGFKVWEYTCQHPTTNTPCLPSGATTSLTNSILLSPTNGKWRAQALKFTTKSNTTFIGIELDARGKDSVAYFDNIQLAPALAIRSNSYAVPSCRLYPEGNSLSCDYGSANNSAIRKKGLLGYCLEYDPANERNCLLWYPLDKVAADPIEEGIGYNGKFPLYYCVEATTSLRLEYRHAFWLNGDDPMECPPHYFFVNLGGGCNSAHDDYACVPSIKSSSSYVLMIPEYEDWGKLIGNYCTKSIINNLVCIDCNEGDDGVTSNVNSLNDGWYLYDEILPYNDHVYYCVNGDNGCSYDNDETECLNHGCSYNELHHFCSWYHLGCSSPKGTLEMFNDNDNSANGMGRGPRLRSKSFSEASLQFLCEASGYHYSEGNGGGGGECINLSNGEKGLLGSEIYRDQFGLVVTNQTSSVPTSAPVYCTKFVEVVDDEGNNTFWANRVKEGSNFQMPCYIPNVNGTGFTLTSCTFLQSSIPFASIAYPAGLGEEPGSWDSIIDETPPGKQPLFYQEAADGVHLGRIFSNNLNSSASPRYLFAQAYGGYEWELEGNSHNYFGDKGQYKQSNDSKLTWKPPTSPCNNGRTNPADYCYIAPQITNVKINGTSTVSGQNIDFGVPVFTVDLTFNSIIDPEQKPLTQIYINWGDGSSVYDRTGSFIDRPDPDTPHRFVHNYTCEEDANHNCQLNKITIQIFDHWGIKADYTINLRPTPPGGTPTIT